MTFFCDVLGWVVSCAVGGSVWETVARFFGLLAVLFVVVFFLLFVFLTITSSREPDLHRDESEKWFKTPVSEMMTPFPSVTDPPSVYMSLVVPAYKEQDRLPVMMDETMAYLERRQSQDPQFTYEVIIVNDGSTDKTSDVAIGYVEKFGVDKVRLLEFTHNRGKGGAVRMGTLSCRGERILMVDADGATKISDMEGLEKALSKHATDHTIPAVAVGSRAHLQEQAVAERSVFRNFLMYGFHILVYVLCVRGVQDTQCGFKMFTRSAAATLFQLMHIHRWAFDVELLYIAQQLHMPISEVAVNWKEIEGSKLVPFWSWLQMGRDILFIRLRYMFGIWTLNPRKQKHQ